MDHLQRLVDLEFLGLTEDDLSGLRNPFHIRTPDDLKEPHKHLLRLMRNPDYFHFTCKHLFEVELMVFQQVLLKEMWIRPFPMLIGSRGLGKSWVLAVYALLRAIFMQGSKIVITGSGFRQAKTVFNVAENIWHKSRTLQSLFAEDPRSGPHHDADRWTLRLGDSTITSLPIGDGCVSPCTLITYADHFGYIYENSSDGIVTQMEAMVWGDGKFRRTDEAYNNGLRPTKIVETVMGFRYESTHNHRMKVVREGRVEWVRADEMMTGDRIMIDRSWRWHAGTSVVSDAEAYALGLMIGDGCYTKSDGLGFATLDHAEFVPALNAGIDGEFTPASDDQHWNAYGIDVVARWLGRWEMRPTYTIDKALPRPIMSAPRGAMTACLQGLFDTDGHVFVNGDKGGTTVSVGLTNTSRELIRQVQFVLLHYGIVAHVGSRDRDENWNTSYELIMTGPDAELFARHIGFRLGRKADELSTGIAAKKRSFTIGDTIPDVKEHMVGVSRRNRIRRGRATAGTTAVSASKLAKRQGITHALAGRFLDVYGHLDDPAIEVVRGLANPDVYYDEVESIVDGICDTFDIHVPDGHEYCANGFFSHNTRIRGERANCILADEFASVQKEVFETVIAGFGVVNLSPVQQVKDRARIRVLKNLNMWSDDLAEQDRLSNIGNQLVISGTAYYQFNHFCDYWKKWKGIVESRGDKKKLAEVFGGDVPEGLDWRDYMVIRMPVTSLPEGYMDEKQVARSKATIHSGIFLNEFGAAFSADSNGFFKRTLVESCVTKTPVTPNHPGAEPVQFRAVTRGNAGCRYVYGVDPASENDRFSITLTESHPGHRRIVYVWTTTRQEVKARLQSKLTDEEDFYRFCVRKIRDLMVTFPTDLIALDSQGGGVAVIEALGDSTNLKEGEQPIYPITADHPLSDGKARPTDDKRGLHIVELVNFAKAEYVSEANHKMRLDFEDKTLLFPNFDPVVLAVAAEDDERSGRMFDTLEDCVMEIEELKDELATITHSQTPGTLRDHWDTPEVKLAGSKKGRLRKDRYSSLLMANYAARRLDRHEEAPPLTPYGGFVDHSRPRKEDGDALFLSAPDWWTRGTESELDGYGLVSSADMA